MKKISFNYYVLFIYLAVCLAAFLILILRPTWILPLFTLHYGFLALALLFMLLPSGKSPLQSSELTYSATSLSPTRWFASVIGYQLILCLLFLGFAEVITSDIIKHVYNPYFHFEPIGFSYFTLTSLFITWGIFPWGIYLILIYIMHSKKQRMPTSTLKPINPVLAGSYYTVNLLIRQAVFWGCTLFIGVTLACIISEIAQQFLMPIPYGIQLSTLFVLICVLAATCSKFWGTITRGLWDNRVSFGVMLAVCCFFVLALILLINSVVFVFNNFHTSSLLYFNVILKNKFTVMRSSNPIREWAILAALWWLAWAPLSATILLRMSRGYSFRRLGVTILLLPTLFTILWALLGESHKIALLTMLDKSMGYPVIISIIGLVILLFILNRSTSFVRLTLATLCVSLDHTCLRLPLRLVRGIMYLISITTVMYLVLGVKPIYWFAVLAILPAYMIYVGRSLLLIKNSLITK